MDRSLRCVQYESHCQDKEFLSFKNVINLWTFFFLLDRIPIYRSFRPAYAGLFFVSVSGNSHLASYREFAWRTRYRLVLGVW